MTALSDALLAYSPWALWLCDGASGNLADSSGNGRTLTAGSGLAYQQAMSGFPGAGAVCIVGDGTINGYANRSEIMSNGDGTIFALANVKAAADLGVVCGIGEVFHNSTSWGISYGNGPANTFSVITNGNTDRADANAAYTLNQFYSLAGVRSGTLFTLYVNGVAQADTTTFSPAGLATQTWLFSDAISATFAGNGGVSHAAIIESALTAPQIAALHNTALGLTGGDAPNMSPPQVGGWGAC